MLTAVNIRPASIPSVFKKVVADVEDALLTQLQTYDAAIQAISFFQGNILEVQQRLVEWSKSRTVKLQRFPCIILLEDIDQVRDERGGSQRFGTAKCQVIICNATRKGWTSEQREEKNFSPVIRPVYYQFLHELSKRPEFNAPTNPRHTFIERKQWGTEDNTANILTDYVDAVELKDLTLTINFSNCYNETFKP